ncbi:MAG: succinyldiaminopimelate transaminase [Pseudomonadota bacterium]
MNPKLSLLEPYPFAKLKALLADLEPAPEKSAIALSIGEPKHASPDFVLSTVEHSLSRLANYPTTLGISELRSTIANWLTTRFRLDAIDFERQILPVNGTREALFAIAQAVVTGGSNALVMTPNPFYQIYEGAALLAGAKPRFMNCTAETGWLPDIDSVSAEEWQQCELLYICTPGNPTGSIMSIEQLQALIEKAREFDFVIASDECYSEIYADENRPPPGLLQACAASGDSSYRNCLAFHSLSKRSNLPGLRSGFVAGDADVLSDFLQYRTYHGCAMPIHHQLASIAAWSNEAHVRVNRQRYREKFDAVMEVFKGHLEVERPAAGFYLWPRTEEPETELTRRLYHKEHVTVLPGRYLARNCSGLNPGEHRLRLALVAELDECVTAAKRIVSQL